MSQIRVALFMKTCSKPEFSVPVECQAGFSRGLTEREEDRYILKAGVHMKTIFWLGIMG